MKEIREIIEALGICSSPVDGLTMEEADAMCAKCPYGSDDKCLNNVMRDAADALAARRWRDPVNDPPKSFTPVIVAREYRRGELKVEEGMLTMNGWWKVYGTNVRRIIAWTPMPEAPEKGDLQWLKD